MILDPGPTISHTGIRAQKTYNINIKKDIDVAHKSTDIVKYGNREIAKHTRE